MNIDELIFTAVFSENDLQKKESRQTIRKQAASLGIFPSSIHALYMAIGQDKMSGFTTPAVNIRALTYDTARIVFQIMQTHSIGPVVFEIARSEIAYTDQRPDEYTVAILAAGIKEGYRGPVFIQGDHFQLSKTKFSQDREQEIGKIKALIKEAIDAQFYNIDIDASTLVDLEKTDLHEQQRNNYEVTAELTTFIRSLQPQGMTISIGGEIGHIGGKNSTAADFEAFMQGYKERIQHDGISKVSVQTGSSHGGMPLPDGRMADVKLDFDVLKHIGDIARNTYHLGGPVQHGASTLPSELFDKFPQVGTLEIHLATGFQNIVYDTIPSPLKQEMYTWLLKNVKDEWEEGWTKEQFLYKTRKKALGPFKKQLWELSDEHKQPIRAELEKQFLLLFEKLKVFGTREIVAKYIAT